MDRAVHDIAQERLAHASRAGRWIARALFIGAGAAIAFALFAYIRPAPWWLQSGLPADPGVFKAKLTVDYAACAPWTSPGVTSLKAGTAGRHGEHLSEAITQTAIAGGEDVDLGVLLPTSAKVQTVFCATETTGNAIAECSPVRCSPPVTALITDSLYTRNRALIFTLKNRAPAKRDPIRLHLWVLWTDGGAAN